MTILPTSPMTLDLTVAKRPLVYVVAISGEKANCSHVGTVTSKPGWTRTAGQDTVFSRWPSPC